MPETKLRRSRSSIGCLQCGYILAGKECGACPECGRIYDLADLGSSIDTVRTYATHLSLLGRPKSPLEMSVLVRSRVMVAGLMIMGLSLLLGWVFRNIYFFYSLLLFFLLGTFLSFMGVVVFVQSRGVISRKALSTTKQIRRCATCGADTTSPRGDDFCPDCVDRRAEISPIPPLMKKDTSES